MLLSDRPFPPSSFSQATAVVPSPVDHTIFTAELKRDWCIGIVPNGGYLMALVGQAVRLYFQTTQPKLNQPDPITFHVEFLARTEVGPASLSVTPLKTGRQFSTVRVQLLQQDKNASTPRLCLEALVTQGNLATEAQNGGSSYPTRPVTDKFSIPKKEICERWNPPSEWPINRPAACQMHIFSPPGTSPLGASPTYGPSVKEQWVRWKPTAGELFDVSSLPYLGDSFGPLVEAYGLAGHWYPTLNFGMEIKKGPPKGKQGWEWLLLRIEVHEIKNGRFDVEVWILDEDTELVALSRHTALIVSAERNTKIRKPVKEGSNL